MPFIKAQPNEYLVTGHKGKIVNRGAAVSVFLWPGTSYVLIPATQQEATFEMTQETQDGIPLRFKGIAAYRVVRPEETARMFDFCHGTVGHDQIKSLLSHIALGELRAQVAHMTMQECIEQRKTTLTDAVASALRQTIQGLERGWGIDLDVVQVAQVFIVDNELRRQMEAEVRNQIRSSSELSNMRMSEELQLANTLTERKRLQETLDTEIERARVEKERARLRVELEQEQLQLQAKLESERSRLQDESERQRIESEAALEVARIEQDAPVQLLRLAKDNQRLSEELTRMKMQLEVRELEVRLEMLSQRAHHELRKEMLPLEQVPLVAEAVGRMFQGANLTFYGEATPLLSALTPALGVLSHALQGVGLHKNGAVPLKN
jgi:regulator of protease activity HflC (stomatin/prohibitin superfamily)